MPGIGTTLWAIPEGCIPSGGSGQERALASHQTVCILNATGREARITITIGCKL